jgi:hypothetical protein
MKSGVPPTLLNALTGELTPPGIDCCALSNSFWLLEMFIFICLPLRHKGTKFREAFVILLCLGVFVALLIN